MYLSKRFAALPPHKKLRARLFLYGGITALLVATALGVAYLGRRVPTGPDEGWVEADFVELPEVRLLQDYIRVDTSQATGSELAGAEFLARELRAAGLEPHIERLGGDRANLWAILEGESPEALVLHNHIDVYPISSPESWDFPPFGGEIDNAWLYGRGAFDMKSVTIAQLMALGDLARAGGRPQRSVVFLATGSEEVGSDLGTRWILRQHPELARRFWAVLTEGGVVEAVSHEEIKYWGIESAQKWFAAGWACSASRQRLEDLKQDFVDLTETNEELRVTPEVESFLSAYAQSREGEDYRRILSDTRRALHHPDQFRRLPPYLKSLFRDEITGFPVETDPEGGFRMRVFLHHLPRSDAERVRQRLLPNWVLHDVSLVLDPPAGAPHGSPLDHPALQALVEVVEQTYPQATVGPYFLSFSATDSRFFREAGIPSYGFSPFLIFTTDTFRRDTHNERIGLPGYVEGVGLYRAVVERLVR